MMRTAFFIVMRVVAICSAMDIIFGDGYSSKPDASTVVGSLGLKPARRRPESVALFLIATVAMAAVLIVEVLA